MLWFQHRRLRRGGTIQDICSVTFARSAADQADLTARKIEQLLPTEMPRSFGFAPGIAIASLVPPMRDVLDRHDRVEKPTAIPAGRAFALCQRRTLLTAQSAELNASLTTTK